MNSPIVSRFRLGTVSLRKIVVKRRRASVLLICGLAAVFLLADISRLPERQLTSRVLVGGIHAYQKTLSGLLSRLGIKCRFRPSCSTYAEVSIENLGAVAGSVYSIKRLLRCGPWTPRGTLDPPPGESRTLQESVASEARAPYAPPPVGVGDDR